MNCVEGLEKTRSNEINGRVERYFDCARPIRQGAKRSPRIAIRSVFLVSSLPIVGEKTPHKCQISLHFCTPVHVLKGVFAHVIWNFFPRFAH